MTNRFQKFAFSVNSTRPHDTDTVAFSNLSTLESVFEIENDTSFSSFSCGRDMKTQQKFAFSNEMHPSGRGLDNTRCLETMGHLVILPRNHVTLCSVPWAEGRCWVCRCVRNKVPWCSHICLFFSRFQVNNVPLLKLEQKVGRAWVTAAVRLISFVWNLHCWQQF